MRQATFSERSDYDRLRREFNRPLRRIRPVVERLKAVVRGVRLVAFPTRHRSQLVFRQHILQKRDLAAQFWARRRAASRMRRQ
jgi:hypothetical protein